MFKLLRNISDGFRKSFCKIYIVGLVSERGFTSEQRKKVIYGREKYRNRRNKE